jgi:acyl carrier protein
MNRSEVEREVVAVLRQSSLRGSERQIGLDDALGGQGLGLDSLGLVEFVTALENRFQIELPDDLWTEREKLSIRHCAELIAKSGVTMSLVAQAYEPIPNQRSTIGLSWSEKATSSIRELGIVRGIAWMVGRVGLHIADWFYLRQKNYILTADLTRQSVPRQTSSIDLILREVSADDGRAFGEFCSSVVYRTIANRRMSMELFRKRLSAGYVCLGAWHDDILVGVSWLSDEGYKCAVTGLQLYWPNESCYAMELFEHPEHVSKGVGLALLGYSLAVAKERGYRKQVTMVLSRNVRMLSAAVQLFGFVKVGEINTTRILFKPFSRWNIAGKSGWGGSAMLSS